MIEHYGSEYLKNTLQEAINWDDGKDIYLYESHLGGLFLSDRYYDDLYCDSCGDSDTLWLGSSKEDVIEGLKDAIKIAEADEAEYDFEDEIV